MQKIKIKSKAIKEEEKWHILIYPNNIIKLPLFMFKILFNIN